MKNKWHILWILNALLFASQSSWKKNDKEKEGKYWKLERKRGMKLEMKELKGRNGERKEEIEERREGCKKGNRKGMQIKPNTYLLMYYTQSLLNKWQDKMRQLMTPLYYTNTTHYNTLHYNTIYNNTKREYKICYDRTYAKGR